MKEKKSILILLVTSSVVVLLLTYLLLTRQMTIPFLYSSKGGQLWQLGVVNTTSPLEIDTNNIHWIPKEMTNQFPVPGIFITYSMRKNRENATRITEIFVYLKVAMERLGNTLGMS